MALKHPVNDTDTHFKIDGITRSVKNLSETKTMLVQYDHNSEVFTFSIPRTVDGHDLSLCNVVRVHYINVEKSRRTEQKGFSDITETLAVNPEDDTLVTCSWLIPNTATQLVGSLHFVIQFACIEGSEILYSWNTAKHTSVTITDGIYSGDEVIAETIDVLEDWRRQLEANHIVSVEQTQFGDGDGGENVWTATFGDGRTSEFTVKNGSKGETGIVGSIETITGDLLGFFVGTKAEYNALTVEQKRRLFAIITDDTTKEELFEDIEEMHTKYTTLRSLLNSLIIQNGYEVVTTTKIREFKFTGDFTTDGYAYVCYIDVPLVSAYGCEYEITNLTSLPSGTSVTLKDGIAEVRGMAPSKNPVPCSITYKRRLKLLT